MSDQLYSSTDFWETLRLIIDLLFVAFIIYRVVLLLNRTRAMQLLIGAGVILILDVLARRLELMSLSWVITNVSSYLVFALIVLLQPELRRLVSEIGQMPIFQWINKQKGTSLDEICEAVIMMGRSKTGSIICILKEIKPQTIIDNAVRLDAHVTMELLVTIFQKDTALHDGAVLIENDRIVAASCYLPLSGNQTILKKTHGARHRAALGMAEESDALIIVTSEETGKISVLYRSEMLPSLRNKDIKPIMETVLNNQIRNLNEIDHLKSQIQSVSKDESEKASRSAQGKSK